MIPTYSEIVGMYPMAHESPQILIQKPSIGALERVSLGLMPRRFRLGYLNGTWVIFEGFFFNTCPTLVCTLIERREKMLVPKFDSLQKHVLQWTLGITTLSSNMRKIAS
jgi:hypothetical protein